MPLCEDLGRFGESTNSVLVDATDRIRTSIDDVSNLSVCLCVCVCAYEGYSIILPLS